VRDRKSVASTAIPNARTFLILLRLLHPLGYLCGAPVRVANQASGPRPDAADPCVRTQRELDRTLRAGIRTHSTHVRTGSMSARTRRARKRMREMRVRTWRASARAIRVNARALRVSLRAVRFSARPLCVRSLTR
jgi:hypothetical protein